MILGIGTDLASIRRMAAALERHGDRFAWRILAEDEREAYLAAQDKPRFLSKRFAAKEAFGKALGTGVARPATLHQVRVAHDPAGRPLFAFGDELAEHMRREGLRAHLSISDEEDLAQAFAIIERT
ncbi:MAG: holo-ACP synthase [Rhodocyclaceae bacterium]|nr:holo-ACP synthase [Rhodocyclaceae bacterium]